MPRYRHALPQLNGRPVITDGGLETDLLFHKQIDLPEFCSFPLVTHDEGRSALRGYLDGYAAIARRHGLTLLLESATWRASRDWVRRLGFGADRTRDINRQAIDLLVEFREANAEVDTLVSGCIGPRGDGYVPDNAMTIDQAREYHAEQARALAESEADLISALTLNEVDEAIGVALAARDAGMPCAISFTVETDGRLPTGQTLADAIRQTDGATGSSPAYYMINCAHPKHFDHVLIDEDWAGRVRGVRANASTLSHAELEERAALDEGDPDDLASRMRKLKDRLPQLTVLGGCCGTDSRHLAAICDACFPADA